MSHPQLPSPTRLSSSVRQSGFTLVELMVSLLIGLFLMGGLMALLQSNKRAFSSQTGLSQLQDGERLALIMLTDVIQQAGYFPDPTTNTAASALPAYTLPASAAPATGTLAVTQAVSGTYSATAPGDTITARYTTAPQDGILNCSGSSNTNPLGGANANFVNTFFVSGPTAAIPNTLFCVRENGTPYPLVSGITNMSILYGVSTAGGTNVDTYMNATQVTAAAAWGNVVSALITLTFTNPLVGQPGQPTTVTPATFQVQRFISLMKQV